jgi:hypothetical protein
MESISSAPKESGSRSGGMREHCYVGPPAFVVDVMREQMEFLLAHAGRACAPECPECARLGQVREFLLRPFC